MDQQPQFIADYLRDRLSVTELCTLYGVSPKTGYTWIDRSRTHGPQGLKERSRRPRPAPRHTPDHVAAALLDARRRPPSWGAKTLGALLSTRHPPWPWPARSTVGDLLSRHNSGPQRRQRRAIGPPGPPTRHITAPNKVWSAAVTGPFKTGAGRPGSPLPLTEGDSRCLLGCEARSSPRGQEAQPVFTRVFQDIGVPPRLRTALGGPFAPNPLARRSPWSAWWVGLGLLPARIAPGKPPQHGRHERLHRTLQADTTRPPGAHLRAPPRPGNPCREEFTH